MSNGFAVDLMCPLTACLMQISFRLGTDSEPVLAPPELQSRGSRSRQLPMTPPQSHSAIKDTAPYSGYEREF
jgi:hypothetical protein